MLKRWSSWRQGTSQSRSTEHWDSGVMVILWCVHQDECADSLALNEAASASASASASAALLFSSGQLYWGSHCHGCVVYGVMLLVDHYGELEVLERAFISNRCNGATIFLLWSALTPLPSITNLDAHVEMNLKWFKSFVYVPIIFIELNLDHLYGSFTTPSPQILIITSYQT